MNFKYQRFGVWSGVGFFFLFFTACVMAGMIPPPRPTLAGAELLAQAQDNRAWVGIGMILGYLSAALLVPWTAVIALQMARIEGPMPMMSLTAFGAGIANAVAFFVPFVLWSGAFYRADRSPELVQMLNDVTWLEFVMLYMPFVLQTMAIAMVGLSDKSPLPTFPRWFCFLSIWVSILVVPGGLGFFFFRGPFAWNGLIVFWIPVVAFTIYFCAIVPLLFMAIRRQEMEASWDGQPELGGRRAVAN